MGRKLGEGLCPFLERRARPHVTQCARAKAYLRTKWHLNLSSRLATTDMGRKLRGCSPFFGEGSWVPIQHNVACAKAYVRTKWHIDPSSRLATINGPKIGGCCPTPFLEGAGSPSSTMSPVPRPISLPSGILTHPAIWSQQIWAENWGLLLFGGGEAGSPSNTMRPGRGLPACQVSS